MSAIAARRAAALLSSTNPSPSSSTAVTPSKAQSPSPSPEIEESDSEAESSTPPPPPPSSKKRKLRRSSPASTPQARYHQAPQSKKTISTVQVVSTPIKQNQQRRFSPSAPAENFDLEPESESEIEDDSSVGDSDADLAEDGEEEAVNEVDEGRAKWILPTTSVESTPGPSRVRPRPSIPDPTSSTSKFTPVDGVNIHKVSESDLQKAGLNDDCLGDGIIISLNREETIVIAGTYILTPLSGSISISSCTISSDGSSYPVFAPTSHPIPVVAPSQQSSKSSSPAWLSKLKLPESFKKGETVLLIRENQCGIDGLRYGAVPGFAHIWLEEVGSWGLRGVHPVIGSFSTPIYPHITPSTWSEALSSLPSTSNSEEYEYESSQTPFVGLVKGPKRSGKSTFARVILNNLLEKYERVAWLECDLGQGEFSAGGVVGLWVLDKQVLGPSFTHPLIPYRAHYLGTYTPLTCPDEYISSLRHLLEIYKFDIQNSSSFSSSSSSTLSGKLNDIIPLIINTQGWVKGLGEDLLRSIESLSEPNHIYSFNSIYEDENPIINGNGWTNSPNYQNSFLPNLYSNGNNNQNEVKQIILESAPITPLQARFTAADFRVLSMISYFHSSLASAATSHTTSSSSSAQDSPQEGKEIKWDFNKPITNLNPYEISYSSNPSDAINKIYLIGEGSEGILNSDLNLALNGSVVALIEFLDYPSSSSEDEEVYIQGRALPPVENINFIGLGLIRSIIPSSTSSTNGKIHIVTPLPIEALIRCKGLVKNGSIELPTPGMLDWLNPSSQQHGNGSEYGMEVHDIPFFDSSGIEVVGGERRRFRKNIMRKGM